MRNTSMGGCSSKGGAWRRTRRKALSRTAQRLSQLHPPFQTVVGIGAEELTLDRADFARQALALPPVAHLPVADADLVAELLDTPGGTAPAGPRRAGASQAVLRN